MSDITPTSLTLEQVHDFLVSNNYVLVTTNHIALSNKYLRDLKLDRIQQIKNQFGSGEINLLKGLIKYLKENGVASTAKNNSGSYAVFKATKENEKRLSNILSQETDSSGNPIDFEVFCKATYKYYKHTAFPVTLTKYLDENVWLFCYEEELQYQEKEVPYEDRRSLDL